MVYGCGDFRGPPTIFFFLFFSPSDLASPPPGGTLHVSGSGAYLQDADMNEFASMKLASFFFKKKTTGISPLSRCRPVHGTDNAELTFTGFSRPSSQRYLEDHI